MWAQYRESAVLNNKENQIMDTVRLVSTCHWRNKMARVILR